LFNLQGLRKINKDSFMPSLIILQKPQIPTLGLVFFERYFK